MAVSTRKRRQITVDGRAFVWFVRNELDYCDRETLTIISQDRRVQVRFPLLAAEDRAVAVVMGPEFGGLKRSDGWGRYVEAPRTCEHPITPRAVRDLISWICDEKKTVVELDWTHMPKLPLKREYVCAYGYHSA